MRILSFVLLLVTVLLCAGHVMNVIQCQNVLVSPLIPQQLIDSSIKMQYVRIIFYLFGLIGAIFLHVKSKFTLNVFLLSGVLITGQFLPIWLK
ncbi:hypothetical protein GCM10023313_20040 [Mucilaginibacter defluvii]|uniref:Uncharacterized protein n=1 Tax=Mucilaginibacter defluvii TaxID=1196019 RepID=A0ABP9FT93_9SPHI